MELKRFRESKLALPLAVVAASLGITACGTNDDLPPKGKYTDRGYEQKLDGETYRIECDGNELVKKLDASWGATDQFSYRYPNHPACDDGQLTESDNNLFSRDPFVNEYTYPASAPDQTPGK